MSLAVNMMDVEEAKPILRQQLGNVIDALRSFGDHGPVLRAIEERDEDVRTRFEKEAAARAVNIDTMIGVLLPLGRDTEAAEIVDQQLELFDHELRVRRRIIDLTLEMIEGLMEDVRVPGLTEGVLRTALMSVVKQPIREYDEHLRQRDRLLVLAAEIDPAATGGPTFDNADDFLRSLRA
ncbi:hypothetical protein [Aureimonas sp. ME7]|uniref:hypothetical protein n=1 Tax=Aureimonas sp. ME7 TaxID=2744252 RepID=UPI0015FC3744|nr:hypothetical protein [Aureimonas sp. ME7]